MLIKQTKTGKISMLLPLEVRTSIWDSLLSFCEGERVKQMRNRFSTKEEVMSKLLLLTLTHIIKSKSFHLQANWSTRILFQPNEVAAIAWLLRDSKELVLIDLKSSLHKITLLQ